jgi:hypothetical protein
VKNVYFPKTKAINFAYVDVYGILKMTQNTDPKTDDANTMWVKLAEFVNNSKMYTKFYKIFIVEKFSYIALFRDGEFTVL